jgi:hypothetical protein
VEELQSGELTRAAFLQKFEPVLEKFKSNHLEIRKWTEELRTIEKDTDIIL